jgi:hypothetical protein
MSVEKPWSKASLRCFCPWLFHTLFAQRKHSRLIHTEAGSTTRDILLILASRQIGEQATRWVSGEGVLLIIVFPRWITQFTAFGVDRLAMASDLCEVVRLEGQAQCLQKPGNLLGGLVGEIRGEGKVEWWSLGHRLSSMLLGL